MIYFVGAILLLLLVYGPSFWVRFILRKYSRDLEALPGTGGELAQHLLDRFEMHEIKLVRGKQGEDFYAPDIKTVSLSPDHFDKRSLAAVAVAAHEVGHAIQFYRQEPVSQLREKYLEHAFKLRRLGGYLLMAMPVLLVVVRNPAALVFLVGAAVVTMLLSVLMYVAILPEEYDASFNKALPLLQDGYLTPEQLPAARQVLRACAMTYVAAALAEVLSLWRWLRYLR